MVLTRMGAQFRIRQRLRNRLASVYRSGGDMFNPANLQIDEADPFPPLQDRAQLVHGFIPPRDIRIYNPAAMIVRKAATVRDLGNDERARHTRLCINRIAKRALRAGIRYRRLLSFGGMGVTCLFEVKNMQGMYNKCVVKIAKPDCEEELYCEKTIMNTLKGAPHIVQIKTARELRGLPGGYASQAVNGAMPQEPPVSVRATDMNEVDRDPSILMMEYLRMGTLGHWIEKVDSLNSTPPDDVLWQMFACLVDGCIAMAYPPRYQEQNVGKNSMLEYVPAEDELRRNRRNQKVCNYVHFDLDPSNVLVDGFDNGEHNMVPRIKIADFGTTLKADLNFMNNKQRLWSQRFIGKQGYLMPEQWTAEWELVEGNPLRNEPEACRIAGSFDERSNIWQIGMVMLNLITCLGPETPPYARNVRLHRNGPNDVLHRGYRIQNRVVLTHGYMLNDAKLRVVERELREVVMACLAYKPEQRPLLEDLLDICDARLHADFPNANPHWAPMMFSALNYPDEKDPTDPYNDADGAAGGDGAAQGAGAAPGNGAAPGGGGDGGDGDGGGDGAAAGKRLRIKVVKRKQKA
ncbi:hypothetical protein CMQ_3094 [Grosmannia clavigera kw1407]|uniref:Protein kinase domain-containing protein n=1 Tax=Grosmannia clavigera (strain kw1407 / UAMH 11150) TaxID=655863 RepID=F0XIA9_GROCL|nr:uncharacterized protein CMQ_3094 [Grosmannia clavigera kw1407]EFX03165.1 hypothetical protein CMQ_3094 [Grosmannia clavigera kw1407]